MRFGRTRARASDQRGGPIPPADILATVTFGCQSPTAKLFRTEESQVQLRAFQSQVFDDSDAQQMLRVVIGTLLDLGFVLDQADRGVGMVSATKFQGLQRLRITVTVRPRGSQVVVRAGAQFGIEPVEDPEPYQDFFATLDKSRFLASR